MLPRGLASRAGAASGIIPFGTTAEAWGAATELGQDRAGNARLILDPRKHGLELSRDGSSRREPRSKRRKAGAPRYGAQPRLGINKRRRLLMSRGTWLTCAFRRFASLLLPEAN